MLLSIELERVRIRPPGCWIFATGLLHEYVWIKADLLQLALYLNTSLRSHSPTPDRRSGA